MAISTSLAKSGSIVAVEFSGSRAMHSEMLRRTAAQPNPQDTAARKAAPWDTDDPYIRDFRLSGKPTHYYRVLRLANDFLESWPPTGFYLVNELRHGCDRADVGHSRPPP